MTILELLIILIKSEKILFSVYLFLLTLAYSLNWFIIPLIASKIVKCLHDGLSVKFWIGALVLSYGGFCSYWIIEYFFTSKFIPKIELRTRTMLINRVNQISIEEFYKKSEGDFSARVNLLVDQVVFLFQKAMGKAIPLCFVTLSIVFKFFLTNIYMGTILMFWIIIHTYICYSSYNNINILNKKEAHAHVENNAYIINAFKNRFIMEIRDTNNSILKKLDNLQYKKYEAQVNKQKAISIMQLKQDVLALVLQAFLTNSVLIYLFYIKYINFDRFVTLFQLIGSVIAVVWRLIENVPDIFDAIDKSKPGLELFHYKIEKDQNRIIDYARGAIDIYNIKIQYKDKLIMEKVSLSINPGDKVIIIGKSGCGKSTLLNTIYGLIAPKEGHVNMDGMNVRDLDKNFKSGYCNFITARKIIFHDTLKNNLFCQDEKLIEHSAHISCLKNVIDDLPHGINTIIDNDGSSLSSGQLQRVNICRSIINHDKSFILLMDEPLTSLDDFTASSVIENIMDVYNNKTVICIDHSLKFIEYAEKVIFFHNSSIKFGTIGDLQKDIDFQNYINNPV